MMAVGSLQLAMVESLSSVWTFSDGMTKSGVLLGMRKLVVPPNASFKSGVSRQLSFSSRRNTNLQKKAASISLCTNSESVDITELAALLTMGGQNCEQFPNLLSNGTIVPVNPEKLRCALRHSTVVVALYIEGEDSEENNVERDLDIRPGAGWLNYWKPRPTGPKTLVAFGRATSDHTLTASIYDLVVAPSHRHCGYGSRVLQRIIRDLRRRGIFDIAVTTKPELRPFFEQCGFGPDVLQSITMMYTRSPSSTNEARQTKKFGRKMFVVPSPLTATQGKESNHVM